MDYINEIFQKQEELTACIKHLKQNGIKLAEAERDYKICLRHEALKLRADNNMPVTLINQIIYGVPEVAKKRFDRDIAETMRNTALEKINVLKLQIRILQHQIELEYDNANRSGV